MKRRSFIRNTGLTIAGLAVSKSIFSNNNPALKSLNIIILMSGGVQYHDIIDDHKSGFSLLFQEPISMNLNCCTQVKYSDGILDHTPAVLNVLQGIKNNPDRKIFFGNINSETTRAVKNSDLNVEIMGTSAAPTQNNYRNDAAVFEKAFAYLNANKNENKTLILNLEDTDIAHCNREKYLDILNFYNQQINDLCKVIYHQSFSSSYDSKLMLVNVLGRNNFENEIFNDDNKGGSDHYHESARDLFSFTTSGSQNHVINFNHETVESKNLLEQLYKTVI